MSFCALCVVGLSCLFFYLGNVILGVCICFLTEKNADLVCILLQ